MYVFYSQFVVISHIIIKSLIKCNRDNMYFNNSFLMFKEVDLG